MIYELDFPGIRDKFQQIIKIYFNHLNKEQYLTNNNPLNIWLAHLIVYPEKYIYQLFVNGCCNDYIFTTLNLSLCGCTNVSYDLLLSDVRMDTEKKY